MKVRLSSWLAVSPWSTVRSPDGSTWVVLPTSCPPAYRLRSPSQHEIIATFQYNDPVEIIEPTESEVVELLHRELGAELIRRG